MSLVEVTALWNLASVSNGAPVGQVWFTPSVNYVRIAGVNYILTPVVGRIRNGVMDPVQLCATDIPDSTPSDWHWRVSVIFMGEDRDTVRPFNIAVPHSVASIDVGSVVPYVPSPLQPVDAATLRAELLTLIEAAVENSESLLPVVEVDATNLDNDPAVQKFLAAESNNNLTTEELQQWTTGESAHFVLKITLEPGSTHITLAEWTSDHGGMHGWSRLPSTEWLTDEISQLRDQAVSRSELRAATTGVISVMGEESTFSALPDAEAGEYPLGAIYAAIGSAIGAFLPLYDGVEGQILTRRDDAAHAPYSYPYQWDDPPVALPAGGTTGQLLAKQSGDDGDVAWVNPSTGGSSGLTGTGFPEGVVTAGVGTYYTDTAATNGAIRWVKATGTGATGWRVVYGDTGWRNVSDWLDPAVWGTISATYPAMLMWRMTERGIETVLTAKNISGANQGLRIPVLDGFLSGPLNHASANQPGIGAIDATLVFIEWNYHATHLGRRCFAAGAPVPANQHAKGRIVYTPGTASPPWVSTLPGTAL